MVIGESSNPAWIGAVVASCLKEAIQELETAKQKCGTHADARLVRARKEISDMVEAAERITAALTR